MKQSIDLFQGDTITCIFPMQFSIGGVLRALFKREVFFQFKFEVTDVNILFGKPHAKIVYEATNLRPMTYSKEIPASTQER